MKNYISRIAVAVALGISVLPALTPSAQAQTRPWWFYGCPKGVVAQIPGDGPGPRHCGVYLISKLLATKLKCVASTECPNSAHSCQ